jgi:hypothetical protein
VGYKKSFLASALTTKELLAFGSIDKLITIVKAKVIARLPFLRLMSIYLEQYLS